MEVAKKASHGFVHKREPPAPSVTISHREPPFPKYLRLAQLVPAVVPVSPATIWRWVKEERFPAPRKLSTRVTAWETAEVYSWLHGKHAAQ